MDFSSVRSPTKALPVLPSAERLIQISILWSLCAEQINLWIQMPPQDIGHGGSRRRAWRGSGWVGQESEGSVCQQEYESEVPVRPRSRMLSM